MILGYARVLTSDQSLDGQRDALAATGAGRLYADTIAGTARHRPELDRLFDQLRLGDVVVVPKYDWLARSLKDLLTTVETVESKSAGFRSLAEDIGTTTPARGAAGLPCLCLHRRVRAGPDRGAHPRGPGGRAPAGPGSVTRSLFLSAWTDAVPDRATRVIEGTDERIVGFATARACRSGCKVGPIIAPDAETALALAAALPFSGPASIDVPEANHALIRALGERGYRETFRTARMYRGPVPVGNGREQAIATMELG